MEDCADETLQKRTRIPDDTLLYAIFPDFALQHAPPQTDSHLAEADLRLNELQIKCLDSVSPIVKDYIWQHQSFNLQTSITSSCPCISTSDSSQHSSSCHAVPHVHGRLKYGDNVEDEWFAVFILYEITKHLPNVSVRAWDTDGEFLLIEAAYTIPRWLKPENSWNRVFIRQGALHILPLPSSPAQIYQVPVKPSIWDSLRILTSGAVETRAGDSVQAAVNRCLAGYPEKAQMNMHRVRCRVPVSVAQVLKHEPYLISVAVEAFYDRDVDSMKAASRMEKFLSSKEMVDISVRMSRAMYAQLVQQVFQAPRCYPMPPFSSPNYKEAELGMKISCGFEMMYHQRSQYGLDVDNGKPEINLSECESVAAGNLKLKGDRNKDIGWEAYRKSLENRGYFRGLLEGSTEYRRLMDDALDHYKNSTLFSRVSTVMHAPVGCINEILAMPHSASDFVGLGLPPSDDDAWLYSGEDDLNTALLERQKEMDSYETERLKHKQVREQKPNYRTLNTSKDNTSNFSLEDVAKNMQAFVGKMSSYEGAEVPTNGDPEAVSMDMRQFMKELKLAMGHDFRNKGVTSLEELPEKNDYSSSDMDFDEIGSDKSETSAIAETHEGVDRVEGNETNDTFMDDYTDALKEELKNTTLTKSFVRAENYSSSGVTNEAPINAYKGTENEELTPVDIDFNLVQSLLDSFSSQQGLPGPASNLLGLMGLQLPDDSKKRKCDS